MESLIRSVRAHYDKRQLPTVFPALAEKGAHIRPAQFTLIASGPGRGKSLLALNLLLRSGCRTLYISPDQSMTDTFIRAGANLSGDTLDDVELALDAGAQGFYEDLVAHEVEPRTRFIWEPPTLQEITYELEAFGLAFGNYPELVIVDNLSDIYAADDEWQSLRLTSDYLKAIAHKLGPAVVGLHHLDGDYDDGLEPPPITAVRGKITKKPEQVWTLSGSALGTRLHIHIVKNRSGPASPSGNLIAELNVNYERAEII